MESLALARKIAQVLDSKKAVDIRVIKIADHSTIADYFVIAGATSTTQVKALADEVEHQLGLIGVEKRSEEGRMSASWLLLDYRDVVAHIFHGQTREFYDLERLWADGAEIPLEELLGEGN